MQRIKVLVVDDSAVVRQAFSKIINSDPQLTLVAAVNDPLIAIRRMAVTLPDVIILDVEMPKMDGITFLKKIMKESPLPVVMCSTLTEQGSRTTMQAISEGAVDFVTKPKIGAKSFLEESSSMLLDVIKSAAQANVNKLKKNSQNKIKREASARSPADDVPAASQAMSQTTERIVAMGTSTGGTQALEVVLSSLPKMCPGIVIVQHMPEKFTAAFASRLNDLCRITVKEAADGDRVLPGQALIAPGGRHMLLERSGARYFVKIKDGPPVSRHRPSVDVLFRSVARTAGKNALGIIMTGMGDDGASGLLDMHDMGAQTVAQDEATSVVYGMPREAVKRGAVDREVPLAGIGEQICSFTNKVASIY